MATTNAKTSAETSRQFLRHVLATIAYRGGKAMRGAPAGFAEFHASETTRTPGQILAHIGDLLDWALAQASGKEKWSDSKPVAWDDEVKRFFSSLQALDDYIGSDSALGCTLNDFFRGRSRTCSLTLGKSRCCVGLRVLPCARRIILAPKSLRAESVPNKLRLPKNSIDRTTFSLREIFGQNERRGK
jgi:hypothetical protein